MNSKNNTDNYKRKRIGGGGLEWRANTVNMDSQYSKRHSLKKDASP